MPIVGPTSDHKVIRQWAKTHHLVPAEKLPGHVDGEPPKVCFMSAAQAETKQEDMRLVGWEEFFAKFDLHGLTLVFDDATGYNEMLQIEASTPYDYLKQHPPASEN